MLGSQIRKESKVDNKMEDNDEMCLGLPPLDWEDVHPAEGQDRKVAIRKHEKKVVQKSYHQGLVAAFAVVQPEPCLESLTVFYL